MIAGYSNPSHDNWPSEPGMIKSSIFFFSEAKFGLKLFIPGNSCMLAICRRVFVCFISDVRCGIF